MNSHKNFQITETKKTGIQLKRWHTHKVPAMYNFHHVVIVVSCRFEKRKVLINIKTLIYPYKQTN